MGLGTAVKAFGFTITGNVSGAIHALNQMDRELASVKKEHYDLIAASKKLSTEMSKDWAHSLNAMRRGESGVKGMVVQLKKATTATDNLGDESKKATTKLSGSVSRANKTIVEMERKVNAVGKEFRELEQQENLFTKEVQQNAAKISASLKGIDTDVVKVEMEFESLIRQIDEAADELDAAGENGTQFRVEMIRNLNKVQAEFDKTKQSAKETSVQVERIGSAAMRSQARMQSLWQRTNQVASSMSRLGTSAAFALGSIVYGVQRALGVYADWGLQIQKVNLLTGLSVERSSQLVGQWKMMGILPKAGATALRYLSKNLETAKSDLDKYEKRAGFSQRSFELGTLRQKLASEASAKTSALSLQAANTAAAAAAQKASISYANSKAQLEKAIHASKLAITGTQELAAKASIKSATGSMEALGISAMQRSEAAALAKARADIASGKTTNKEALRKMQEKLMADRLEFALPSTVKSFGSLGITPEQLKSLSTQDIIEKTLAALAKLPSTERTKYMVKLLGRQGSEIVRWLKLSAKEKEKLAVVVKDAGLEWAEDDLAEWDKYYKGKKIMELQWIALQITLSKSIMPWVLKLIHYSVELTKRLTPYADNIKKIVLALGLFVVVTKGASASVLMLAYAFKHPLLTAIGYVLTGLVLLYKKSEGFRDVVKKLGSAVVSVSDSWMKWVALGAIVFAPLLVSLGRMVILTMEFRKALILAKEAQLALTTTQIVGSGMSVLAGGGAAKGREGTVASRLVKQWGGTAAATGVSVAGVSAASKVSEPLSRGARAALQPRTVLGRFSKSAPVPIATGGVIGLVKSGASGVAGIARLGGVALASPWGMAIGVMVAVAGAGYLLYKNWKRFRDLVNPIGAKLKEFAKWAAVIKPEKDDAYKKASSFNWGVKQIDNNMESIRKLKEFKEIKAAAEIKYNVSFAGPEEYVKLLGKLTGPEAKKFEQLKQDVKTKFDIGVSDPTAFLEKARKGRWWSGLQKEILTKFNVKAEDKQQFLKVAQDIFANKGIITVTVKDSANIKRFADILDRAEKAERKAKRLRELAVQFGGGEPSGQSLLNLSPAQALLRQPDFGQQYISKQWDPKNPFKRPKILGTGWKPLEGGAQQAGAKDYLPFVEEYLTSGGQWPTGLPKEMIYTFTLITKLLNTRKGQAQYAEIIFGTGSAGAETAQAGTMGPHARGKRGLANTNDGSPRRPRVSALGLQIYEPFMSPKKAEVVGTDWMTGLEKGITSSHSLGVLEAAANTVSAVPIDTITKNWKCHSASLVAKDIGMDFMLGLKEGLVSGYQALVGAVGEARRAGRPDGGGIFTIMFRGISSSVIRASVEMVKTIRSGVKDILGSMGEKLDISMITTSIRREFLSYWKTDGGTPSKRMMNLAGYLVDGFIKGLRKNSPSVEKNPFMGGLWQQIVDFWETGSASRRGVRIGKDIGQGVIDGMGTKSESIMDMLMGWASGPKPKPDRGNIPDDNAPRLNPHNAHSYARALLNNAPMPDTRYQGFGDVPTAKSTFDRFSQVVWDISGVPKKMWNAFDRLAQHTFAPPPRPGEGGGIGAGVGVSSGVNKGTGFFGNLFKAREGRESHIEITKDIGNDIKNSAKWIWKSYDKLVQHTFEPYPIPNGPIHGLLRLITISLGSGAGVGAGVQGLGTGRRRTGRSGESRLILGREAQNAPTPLGLEFTVRAAKLLWKSISNEAPTVSPFIKDVSKYLWSSLSKKPVPTSFTKKLGTAISGAVVKAATTEVSSGEGIGGGRKSRHSPFLNLLVGERKDLDNNISTADNIFLKAGLRIGKNFLDNMKNGINPEKVFGVFIVKSVKYLDKLAKRINDFSSITRIRIDTGGEDLGAGAGVGGGNDNKSRGDNRGRNRSTRGSGTPSPSGSVRRLPKVPQGLPDYLDNALSEIRKRASKFVGRYSGMGEGLEGGGAALLAKAMRVIFDKFSFLGAGSMYRRGATVPSGGPSLHAMHRAVDFVMKNQSSMVGNKSADRAFSWMVDNAGSLGAQEIIHDDKIWSLGRPELYAYLNPATGKIFPDDSNRHRDHIHFGVRAGDALASAGYVSPAGSGGGNADNVSLGKRMASAKGWVGNQFDALYALWMRESNWDELALNRSKKGNTPYNAAYGIPQALPGSKMAQRTAGGGPKWLTDPMTQIRWGLNYIDERYGTPVGAMSHSTEFNWYGNGGRIDKPTVGVMAERNREWIFDDQQLKQIVAGGRGQTIKVEINNPHFLGRPSQRELDILSDEISGAIANKLVAYGRGA